MVKVLKDQKIDFKDIPVCDCVKGEPGYCRPNIILNNDKTWNSERSDEQEIEYKTFMEYVQDDDDKLMILELGLKDDDKILT